MTKNSRITVFGSSGFVGRTLIKRLEHDGYSNITKVSRELIDLTNQYQCNNFFSINSPEIAFICSAKCGGIKDNMNHNYEFLYENLQIQNNVLSNCIKYNIKTVFLSSNCVYPANYIQPLKEEYMMKDEMEPSNSGYAVAKIAGMELCRHANKQFNSKFIVLTPCNLYGEGNDFHPDKSHVLGALVKKICDAKKNNISSIELWGTGEPRREFLYIDDFVDAIVWSVNALDKTDTHLNVGVGEDISIKELAYKIKEIVGYTGNIIFNSSMPNGMMKKLLCVDRINSLGWKSKTGLDVGLKRTIDYYEQNFTD